MRPFIVLSFFLIVSCTQFVKSTDTDYFEETFDSNSNQLQVYFSHNINGETHPCGCRNFPLGGLPQVYGEIASKKNATPTLYIDSGDTFFPLPIVPQSIRKSTEFTARKIAESMDMIGLNYFTPGDQDFALGEKFLIEISQKHKFKFLISNSSASMKIKHRQLGIIKSSKTTFYIIGITDPGFFQSDFKNLFTQPEVAIKKQIDFINTQSGNKKIILVSHSGLEQDQIYAKKFPQIDWIIGSHSQSYLYHPVEVGNTKLVQVLSRNHFLGHLNINLNENAKSHYEILEMRDEKKDLLKNNDMIPWLAAYKSNLERIQEEEQNIVSVDTSTKPLPTFSSCLECHSKQTEFWQSTSHSLAFSTLIDANASHNQACIVCHTVGYKNPQGFITPKKMILSEREEFDIKKYWKEFSSHMNLKGQSIRKLSNKQRTQFSKKLISFDEKNKVTHNFSNVQCLNCHNQTSEHPFDVETAKVKPDYQKACLNCHTPDQSPSWYTKDSKKLATSINAKYFEQKLKQVSCPKIER